MLEIQYNHLWYQCNHLHPGYKFNNLHPGYKFNQLYVVHQIKMSLYFSLQCMAWAWYLANDMQFFVASPIIIIAMYK
jgi:hypothetical protein